MHWIALQSIAWTTMLVQNSQHAPLSSAISKTFDGAHPCSLCHFVSKGKNSEKKSDLQQTTAKIDMLCATRTISLARPFARFCYLLGNLAFSERDYSPPVPPPRALA
jgi:hypothetical protein